MFGPRLPILSLSESLALCEENPSVNGGFSNVDCCGHCYWSEQRLKQTVELPIIRDSMLSM